jgi:hypothetical protein
LQIIKGLIIEYTFIKKSPLSPFYQRGVYSLPLEKGGEEGFYRQWEYYYETVITLTIIGQDAMFKIMHYVFTIMQCSLYAVKEHAKTGGHK